MAARAESAVVGDYVPPVFSDDVAYMHVHERCPVGEARPARAFRRYVCLSCRQGLANAHQLDAHLETGADQPHMIARECPEHGWETL